MYSNKIGFFLFIFTFIVSLNLKNNVTPVLIQIQSNNTNNEQYKSNDKEEHIKELSFLELIHKNLKNISDMTKKHEKIENFKKNLKLNINQIENKFNNTFKKCSLNNTFDLSNKCNNKILNYNIAIKEKTINFINQITEPINKKELNLIDFNENKFNEKYDNEDDKKFYFNLLFNLQSYYQYQDLEEEKENKTELSNLISKVNEKDSEFILTRNAYAGMLIDKLKFVLEERSQGDDLFMEGKFLMQSYNEKIKEYNNEINNINFHYEKKEKINSLKNEIEKELNKKMECMEFIEKNERCHDVNKINEYAVSILNLQQDVYDKMKKILD
jgi:hypothetical protein